MILITGGAGYVGSILVPTLLKNNYSVRVLDSLIFGKQSLRDVKDKIELVKGDIRNPPKRIFKGIKAVIHLAGLSNDPTANFDPKANYQINALATIQLARLAKNQKVERFIFGSSCSIYDQGLEKGYILQDEKAKVNPTAPYSVSKLTAEENILPLADNKFCVTVLRKGTIFGYSPRMRYDLVVNTMIKDAFLSKKINIKAAGKQWRPLISIKDATKGYQKILTSPITKVNKQIFNLLSDNYMIITVGKTVQKNLKSHIKVNLAVEKVIIETRSYKVSGRKMKELLYFSPSESISSSIKEIIGHINQNQISDFNNPAYYNIQWMKLMYQKGKYL